MLPLAFGLGRNPNLGWLVGQTRFCQDFRLFVRGSWFLPITNYPYNLQLLSLLILSRTGQEK